MAEKDEVATITIGAEEKVDQAFDAAAKAAEDFAKRVNAAFAGSPDVSDYGVVAGASWTLN